MIRHSVAGGVATITLDSPSNRNALSTTLLRQLLEALGAPLGTLSVFGSISQKYRGAVGSFSGSTISAGYKKNYSYDPRLKFAPPPYYLNPVDTAYNRSVFAEIPAAY